jgi:hypothetical protein
MLGMTCRILLSAVLISTVAGQDAASKGHVDGVVVNQATGEPLRKATVTLQGSAPGQTQEPRSYAAVSDPEGRFAVDQIDPGRYTLTADRPGFLNATYHADGAAAITIATGQSVTGIRFALTPQGVIAGRVTDEDGDAITEVQIQVHRWSSVTGVRRLNAMGIGPMVDDQGNFRLANLNPGKYVLSATNERKQRIFNSRSSAPVYVTTYYPSAIEASEAASITVAAGAEVRGIEIRLRKERVFQVSGKLVDARTGEPVNIPLGWLHSGSEAARDYAVARNGVFNFADRLPGGYLIVPGPNTITNEQNYSAKGHSLRYPVTITDHDIRDLVVPVGPGVALAGTIFDETGVPVSQMFAPRQAPSANSASAIARHPNVRLQALDNVFGYQPPAIQSKDDGSFEVRDLAMDRYHITVDGYPSGSYVKSIRLGSQEVKNGIVDLTAGGGALQIVVSSKAADISGTVHNDKGDPVADVTLTVFPASVDSNSAMNLSRADQNGHFKAVGLTPGEYRIIAWEEMDFNQINDPDFRALFDDFATTVKVGENSHEIADVKMVTREAMQAAMSKLN